MKNLKKIVSLLLAVCLLAACLPMGASATGGDVVLTLHYQDGTTEDGSLSCRYLQGANNFIISPPSAARSGYALVGWNTEQDGSGMWFLPSRAVIGMFCDENGMYGYFNDVDNGILNELTYITDLYAQWEPITTTRYMVYWNMDPGYNYAFGIFEATCGWAYAVVELSDEDCEQNIRIKPAQELELLWFGRNTEGNPRHISHWDIPSFAFNNDQLRVTLPIPYAGIESDNKFIDKISMNTYLNPGSVLIPTWVLRRIKVHTLSYVEFEGETPEDSYSKVVETFEWYEYNYDDSTFDGIVSDEIPGKVLKGYNSKKDGTGTWYPTGTLCKNMPDEVWAIWKDKSAPKPTPVPSPTAEPVTVSGEDGVSTITTVISDDKTVTTTAWEDGKEAVAVRTFEGDTTITVTAPNGETMAQVSIPAELPEAKEYEDVNEGDWFEESVKTTTALGLFGGTSATSFSPSTDLDRAMLVTVLYRLSGEPSYGVGESYFADVEENKYYSEAADWAKAAGVAKGTGSGLAPERPITRQEMVTMVYRYVQSIGANPKPEGDLSSFPDGNSVADYAKDAMKWAISTGIIKGKSGKLCPDDTASRAEVSVVLARLVDYLK